MSHLSSSPPKHKGEHKGHSLPRGSERWVGLGAGGSGRGARGQGWGGGPLEWWRETPGLTHLLVQGWLLPGQGPQCVGQQFSVHADRREGQPHQLRPVHAPEGPQPPHQ